jgi:hypothetical protein
METVWDYPRQNKLCATVLDGDDDIVEARKTAWNGLVDDPDRIRSIGTRGRATVRVWGGKPLGSRLRRRLPP